MDLSIIILNYKTKGLLKQCLRGILSAPHEKSYEIIVVDNNSGDGTPEMMAKEFSNLRCVASPKNTGFGQGNSLGIKEANGRYVLVLNPDMIILDNALDQMVNYLNEHPKVGILGPKLLNPDKSIQNSCYRFPSLMIPVYRRTPLGKLAAGKRAIDNYLMNDWNHNEEREVDWLLGGCLMIRREVLNQIGLFDKRFFLYFDDTDYCRRAWEAGWKVVYNPKFSLVHFHRRESAGGILKSLRNKVTRVHIASGLKYFKKYWGKPSPRLSA